MSRRNKKGRDINGVLLLDKASGCSSNSALQDVKYLFNANKAGHTGSLDPLASGLLPICFGQATNRFPLLLQCVASHHAIVQLSKLQAKRASLFVSASQQLDFDHCRNCALICIAVYLCLLDNPHGFVSK